MYTTITVQKMCSVLDFDHFLLIRVEKPTVIVREVKRHMFQLLWIKYLNW